MNKPAERAAFEKKLMPTNEGMLKKLGSMLSAIKHVGKPSTSSKLPFGK